MEIVMCFDLSMQRAKDFFALFQLKGIRVRELFQSDWEVSLVSDFPVFVINIRGETWKVPEWVGERPYVVIVSECFNIKGVKVFNAPTPTDRDLYEAFFLWSSLLSSLIKLPVITPPVEKG